MTRPWDIYTRVSTDDQADAGISLDAQLTASRAYTVARGWTIGEEICDRGMSASTLNRDGVQRVIARMKSGETAGVIVWRLDRLTRSIRDLLTILDLVEHQGVGVVSVTEALDTTTPMGRFVVHLLVLIAQWERETIGARTKAAVHHAKKQGFYTGGPVPAGTQVISDGPRRRLTHGPGADVICQAWEWILAGDSLGDVVKRFTELRVPHYSRGKPTPWTPANVRATLLSPMVVGVLVTPAIQAKVKAVLAGRGTPKRAGKGPARELGARAATPALLVGILKCQACGRPMFQLTATGRGGTYPYYRCTGRPKKLCTNKDQKRGPIEQAVINAFADAVRPGGAYHQALAVSIAQSRGQLDHARAERAALTSTKEQLTARIHDLALRQQIGAPGWDIALTGVGAELHRVEMRLADLAGKIAAGEIDDSNIDLVLSEMERGAEHIAEADPDEQRRILRACVCAVQIVDGKLVLDLYEPAPNDVTPVRSDKGSSYEQKWGSIPHGRRTVRIRTAWHPVAKVPAGSG